MLLLMLLLLRLHATFVRGDDAVVMLHHGVRVELEEVVALLAAALRRYRLAALVEADVALRVHHRAVPQVSAVVDLVELAALLHGGLVALLLRLKAESKGGTEVRLGSIRG